MEKVDEKGGITYHENLVASLVSVLVSHSRGNRVTNWSEPELALHWGVGWEITLYIYMYIYVRICILYVCMYIYNYIFVCMSYVIPRVLFSHILRNCLNTLLALSLAQVYSTVIIALIHEQTDWNYDYNNYVRYNCYHGWEKGS